MTTLAIIGSRNFSNYDLLCDTIRTYFCTFNEYSTANKNDGTGDGNGYEFNFDSIVSGGAKGADSLATRYAREHNIPLKEFLPDWERYGRRAGFIRNEDIVRAADTVLCFWDGQSKGSGNSLSIAKRLKKTTLIVYF